MTTTSTDSGYPPVSQGKDVDGPSAFVGGPGDRDLWTDVHEEVQRQLADLESAVRGSLPGVRVERGSTRGEHFLLFSYGTFSMPGSDVDPVVVGITFTRSGEAISIEANASGEETGDLIASPPARNAGHSRENLLAAARRSARELCNSANAVIAALEGPSRTIA